LIDFIIGEGTMGQWVAGTDPWPTWLIQTYWPTDPLTQWPTLLLPPTANIRLLGFSSRHARHDVIRQYRLRNRIISG